MDTITMNWKSLKLVISLMIFSVNYNCYCQSFGQIQIKEEYDQYNVQISDEYNVCTASPIGDEGNFGEGVSKILEGYLTMYVTTKDKGYLYKYILESLCLMENRHDYHTDLGLPDEPKWMGGQQFWQGDGLILGALARFVYLVKIKEPNLFYESIYQFDELDTQLHTDNTCHCNFTGISFTTLGQYANWLQDRCGESLWWFLTTQQWDDQLGMIQIPGSGKSANLNKHAGFARALLFIGLTANEPEFLAKADIIGGFLTSNVEYECLGNDKNVPLFIVDNGTNSVTWFQDGWSIDIPTNNNDCPYEEFYEDGSHAASDLLMVVDYYNFLPNTPVSLDLLVQLRNTLTNNMYNPNDGTFYQVVNGVDCGTTNCGGGVIVRDNTIMNWMILYPYDDLTGTTSPFSLYNLIMLYYNNNLNGMVPLAADYRGHMNQGHAYVAEAQWANECTNLTLYNRDIVYNQDFFSKCNLTIAPEEGPLTNSYAHPIISTPDFIVEPSIESNFSAATSITFKPGTHFKSGSSIHAYVDPQLCNVQGGGKSNIQPNSNEIGISDSEPSELFDNSSSEFNERENSLNESYYNSYENEFNVYPNPFNSDLNISFLSEVNCEVQIVVVDMFGKEVMHIANNSPVKIGLNNFFVDLTELASGMYQIILFTDNGFKAVKKITKR